MKARRRSVRHAAEYRTRPTQLVGCNRQRQENGHNLNMHETI